MSNGQVALFSVEEEEKSQRAAPRRLMSDDSFPRGIKRREGSRGREKRPPLSLYARTYSNNRLEIDAYGLDERTAVYATILVGFL